MTYVQKYSWKYKKIDFTEFLAGTGSNNFQYMAKLNLIGHFFENSKGFTKTIR